MDGRFSGMASGRPQSPADGGGEAAADAKPDVARDEPNGRIAWGHFSNREQR